MRYILHHTHDHSKAALFILTTTQLRARGRPGARSFRVALRSQPIDTAGSLQPLVGLGFALEPLDVADIGPRIMGLNLPVVLGDALVLEGNARFAHGRQHALVRQKPSLARLFERKPDRLNLARPPRRREWSRGDPFARQYRGCGWRRWRQAQRRAPTGRASRTPVRRSARRDCRSARRPRECAGHWRPPARWRRVAARRRTAPPAGASAVP